MGSINGAICLGSLSLRMFLASTVPVLSLRHWRILDSNCGMYEWSLLTLTGHLLIHGATALRRYGTTALRPYGTTAMSIITLLYNSVKYHL